MNTRAPRVTTLLLRRLALALARHLPAAISGDARGVHQARVTTRRLREAVPVLATGLTGSKAGKAGRKIKRLTRALGTVRELDVTLGLLEELADSPHISRTAVEVVRAHARVQRDARRAVMLRRLDRINLEKLGRRLRSVAEALQGATDEPWRKALAERLVKRSRRLSLAMDEASHMYSPERLHQVRIAVKTLRYGLELASDTGLKQAAPRVRTMKRAQDILGKLHDLQVVQTHVATVQAHPRPGHALSHLALEDLSRHIEERCRHLHGRYVALVPALREITVAVRKVIAPQLAQAQRRRRPLRMTLARVAETRAAGGTR